MSELGFGRWSQERRWLESAAGRPTAWLATVLILAVPAGFAAGFFADGALIGLVVVGGAATMLSVLLQLLVAWRRR